MNNPSRAKQWLASNKQYFRRTLCQLLICNYKQELQLTLLLVDLDLFCIRKTDNVGGKFLCILKFQKIQTEKCTQPPVTVERAIRKVVTNDMEHGWKLEFCAQVK